MSSRCGIASLNFTKKEQEILLLMRSGLNNTEIAERISISVSTIRLHNSAIDRKFGALKRADFVHC
ncbi:response regulator transcription factor [Methylobacterium sp. BE186]|uniref:response regulator transcription factor n=1 Tax=Methylobacterium sp. BE186 TaxID=2817715 RepID=UPI0038621779